MQRYSSGFEHHRGYGVDGPFARLDCVEQDSFDSHWMRPTGKWRRLHAKLTLAEALRMIETDEMLHPH